MLRSENIPWNIFVPMFQDKDAAICVLRKLTNRNNIKEITGWKIEYNPNTLGDNTAFDAFVPINLFVIDPGYKEVAVLQNQIIGYKAALNGKIVKHRGVYNYNVSQDLCTKYNRNPQWYFSYDPNASLNGLYKGQSWYQSPVSINTM